MLNLILKSKLIKKSQHKYSENQSKTQQEKEEALQQKNNEITQFKQIIKKYQDENNQLRDEIKHKEEIMQQSNEEVEKLRNNVERLSGRQYTVSEQEKVVQTLQAETTAAIKVIPKSYQDSDFARQQAEGKQQELEQKLLQKSKEYDTQLAKVQQELQAIKSQYESTNKEKVQLVEQVNSCKTELIESNKKIKSMEQIINNLHQ